MGKLFVLLLSVCLGGAAQTQHFDVQVSDPQDHPVKGLKLTVRSEGDTVITDSAGKARLSYSSPTSTGVLDLLIVDPRNLVFISPWSGSVQVPPKYWALTVTTKGQKEMLKKKGTVVTLVAYANWLQAQKRIGETTPSKLTRRDTICKTAEIFGLNPEELETEIASLAKTSQDLYELAQLALLNHEYKQASELFNSVLKEIDPKIDLKKDTTALQKATNSAFFLGQSLFESSSYREAASAYEKALQLRPEDPVILNSEGLSWDKAGDPDKAQWFFQRSAQQIYANKGLNLIDLDTIRNNLAFAYLERGQKAQDKKNLDSGEANSSVALKLFEKVYGDEHPLTATAMLQLGDIWLDEGRTVDAATLYNKSLAVRVRHFGANSFQAQEARMKLARIGAFRP